MDPKQPRKREQEWEEPNYNRFKKILMVAIGFIFVYGGFLIWRNYYAKDAKPMVKKEAASPYYEYQDTTSKK